MGSIEEGAPNLGAYRSVTVERCYVEQWLADQPEQSAQQERPPTVAPARQPNARRGRLSYAVQDQPLIEEVRPMLTATPPLADTPWEATDAVVGRATGANSTVEAKRKRLYQRYSKAFRTERDGKDRIVVGVHLAWRHKTLREFGSHVVTRNRAGRNSELAAAAFARRARLCAGQCRPPCCRGVGAGTSNSPFLAGGNGGGAIIAVTILHN
jgi:hypothetical protein